MSDGKSQRPPGIVMKRDAQAGRPSALSKDHDAFNQLIADVEDGAPLHEAAEGARVTHWTVDRYMHLGEAAARASEANNGRIPEGQEQYVEFYLCVREAQSRFAQRHRGRIAEHSESDSATGKWPASAWLLERLRKDYRKEPTKVDITMGGGSSPVAVDLMKLSESQLIARVRAKTAEYAKESRVEPAKTGRKQK